MKKHLGNKMKNVRIADGKTRREVAEYITEHGYPTTEQALFRAENSSRGLDGTRFLLFAHCCGVQDLYAEFLELGAATANTPPDLTRWLSPKGCDLIEEITRCVVASGRYEQVAAATVRSFPLSVSAGGGNIAMDDIEPIPVNIPSSSIPFGRKADDFYVLQVAGNSMEPVMLDGDIILIDEASRPRHGEIGVFYFDGSTLVKKFSDTEDGVQLLSLNKEGNRDYQVQGDLAFSFQGKYVGKTTLLS